MSTSLAVTGGGGAADIMGGAPTCLQIRSAIKNLKHCACKIKKVAHRGNNRIIIIITTVEAPPNDFICFPYYKYRRTFIKLTSLK